MNRKEIKESAKLKIKENKWNIIWPMLIIGVIGTIVSRIFGGTINIDLNSLRDLESFSSINITPVQYGGSIISSLVIGLLSAGYLKYILNFARTGKFDTNDIIDTIKKRWVHILIAEILASIIIGACFFLFVIPGIIMTLAYTFVTYLVIDTDVNGNDALKESREMMKGYKWDYFVFGLSFLGWILLVPFTFGILLIWLYPYMTVANAIYYDKLKNTKK